VQDTPSGPSDRPFRSFAQRITRSYVILAVALIVVIVGVSSALAFILYATSFNYALDSMQARYEQRVQYYELQRKTLPQFAKQLYNEEPHVRTKVGIFDKNHHLLAGNLPPRSARSHLIAELVGLHPRFIHIPDGGTIVLSPDFDAFAYLIERYWAIMLPVGLLAVIVAWLVGRSITGRAIQPLGEVSSALHRIAEGDFTPKLLVERDTSLQDLTSAYNSVAYRLNAATIEQRRQEAEMRQFIADAGHELRTPLTIFMGYLDALRHGVIQDSEAITRVHETMLDETRKMRTIIEKLILLARMEREAPPSKDVIDLSSVAQRAIDSLRPIAGDRIRFREDGGATILGDDTELYEAVRNVVENAVRYAPNSPVDVRVQHHDGGASIVVQDRGPGMQSIDVQHAFDRFYRGSSRGEVEGSGLGLAIAKRAVERLGGNIELDSRVNEGTTVTMRFNASPQ
jgi:two-component system OmpR family sensor kinase